MVNYVKDKRDLIEDFLLKANRQ